MTLSSKPENSSLLIKILTTQKEEVSKYCYSNDHFMISFAKIFMPATAKNAANVHSNITFDFR